MNQTFSNGSDALSEQYEDMVKKKECRDSKEVNVWSRLEELKKEVVEGKKKEKKEREREQEDEERRKSRGY